jgi:hypothetical protein
MRSAALSLFALFLSTICLGAGHEVTPPIPGPSPLGSKFPTVASNGESFVVLWYREGEIFGALADGSGRRTSGIDIPVIPYAPMYGAYVTAEVTAVGRDYVLFWSDSTGSYLTDLGPDLKPTRTILLRGLPSITLASIASNGSQILIAGATGNIFPPAQTVAYVVKRDGSLARNPVDLMGVGLVHASWSGKDFLVTIAGTTGLFLERVSADSATRLQITSATGVFSEPMPAFAAAASSGDQAVVVWFESADMPNPVQTFWSATVSDDGHIAKRQIYSQPAMALGGATVLWNGSAYVATIGNVVLRLDRSGSLLEVQTNPGHSIDESASIGDLVYGAGMNAFDPRATITIFQTAESIHNTRSEFLSITPAQQEDSAIASDDVDFMTVFREETATSTSIKAVPVGRSAVASTAEGIQIASTTAYALSSIVHGSSVYLVTWADATGVYMKRVTNQGVAVDADPIKIGANNSPQRPDVAWSGNSFLVAWVGNAGIVAATVGEDGVVSTSRLIASNGSIEPRIAWNGRVFLVVYGVWQQCYFECIPVRLATYGVRVAADGTPIDTNPAQIDGPPNSTSLAAYRATVASNGGDFLVALDKTSGAAIVKVNADGLSIALGQPTSVFPWFYFVTNDIRWSGHDYVLASLYSIGMKTWVSLTHLSESGASIGRSVTAIGNMLGSAPALATNTLGESAVVIAERAGDPPVQRVRVYFDSDFQPSPARPAAPTNVAAIGTPASFTMIWSVGPDADGVVIETTFGTYTTYAVVPASTRSHTFSNPSITSVVLRTVNAGGISDAIGAILQTPPRRRATR